MNPVIFDPSVETLQKIVASTSLITADNLELVHDTRIQLRDARVAIEKQGKSLRAEALKYQKDVIAREKELLGIITPEEERLAAIEEEAKAIKERESRAALLPMRKEQLARFGELPADETILDMDNDAFIVYLNEQQSQKNEADRIAIEAEKAKLARDAELQAAREQERARMEAMAKATEETRIQKAAQEKYDAERVAQKLIDDAKIEAEHLVAVAKAQEEARLREIAVREQQKLDEEEKRVRDARYQAWLGEIGYDAASWHLETKDGVTRAYKFVAMFKHND
jgi:hypothetical protein